MKILIIGRGGRCHALAWKLKQSKYNSEIFVAPGNIGIEPLATCIPIDELDNAGLLHFAQQNNIDLTIVGPESALANGIVDIFEEKGFKIFGPNKKATAIESSKSFAKNLMKKYNIPTAQYEVFSIYKEAKAYLQTTGVPVVIKYDGLAAGKGVVVATDIEQADNALKNMLLHKQYGEGYVIIEEYLEGIEFSLMAFVNGNMVVPMVIAQDHKRAYDNDCGPNTGGMGAYSPVPLINDEIVSNAIKSIMQPVATALVTENRIFKGVLYGGLMLTQQGVKVIEFNARFGDPETEVVLPRLETDLIDVLLHVMDSMPISLQWSNEATLGVVMAAKGYPNTFTKGAVITGAEQNLVFHMGTTSNAQGKIVCNGGRVLMVVGKAPTLLQAQQNAYEKVQKIKSTNLFYRKDIGYQIIQKKSL